MTLWFASAVAVSVLLVAGSADAGSCRAKPHHLCLHLPANVNFNAVPAISNQIVSSEGGSAAAAREAPLAAPPTDEKPFYTGPTIGVSKMGRSPTVGYHWSID